MERIIAIDFDGTIVEQSYPEMGKIKKNAKSIINRLYDEGNTIIIWTVRSNANNALDSMIRFLEEKQIKYHKINENADSILNDSSWTDFSPKIYADIYIDDRGIKGIPGWNKIYKLING